MARPRAQGGRKGQPRGTGRGKGAGAGGEARQRERGAAGRAGRRKGGAQAARQRPCGRRRRGPDSLERPVRRRALAYSSLPPDRVQETEQRRRPKAARKVPERLSLRKTNGTFRPFSAVTKRHARRTAPEASPHENGVRGRRHGTRSAGRTGERKGKMRQVRARRTGKRKGVFRRGILFCGAEATEKRTGRGCRARAGREHSVRTAEARGGGRGVVMRCSISRRRAAGMALTEENAGMPECGRHSRTGSSQRFLSMPGGIQEATPFPATTL